jgi:hypothetical protein
MQISGKEEIRISRCKRKKIFLENIKSVIKMQARVHKMGKQDFRRTDFGSRLLAAEGEGEECV